MNEYEQDKTDEQLEAAKHEAKEGADKIGDAALKIAQETGYAVAGFAGLVGEKAKTFYDEQRQQYAATHPDQDKDPGAKEFLEQLSDRLNKLVDELTKGFKDMAERGRETVKGHPGKTGTDAGAAGFAGEADLHTDPVSETGVSDDERQDLRP